MSCGIYKIQNKLNNKVYIGQSKNTQERWKHHKNSNDNCSIHKAFKKYGIENFDFSIIEECEPSQLNEKEIYWINQYNSYWDGYNETFGGTDNRTHAIKLTEGSLEEITKMLTSNNFTNQEIADKFKVSENLISGINTGLYWKRDNISYPIRTTKHEQKFCPGCGKPIQYTSTRCVDCANKAKRVTERPDKEELFAVLKELNGNFTQVGLKYHVTDNAVRKWCKAYNIPHKSADYKTPTKVRQPLKKYKVQQIDPVTKEVIATFNSIAEAERTTGIYHITEASDETNQKRKSAGGFIWKRI